MIPVKIDEPRKLMDWDVYSFYAYSQCERCGKTLGLNLLIPSSIIYLVPSDKQEKAIDIMKNFMIKYIECEVTNMISVCEAP